ncbi:MAG: hypothetical protein B5M53_04285 [Candidatus Cloacimonas sp. 4484_209]|nr:MAG: hypothetical protein B5M53_04285 [Candidatus Cloacimonas sp. 4484_209]
MGTITVNIDDNVEKKFRKVAGKIYHKKKGYLGRAITEAMKKWLYEKKQVEVAQNQIKLLEKGFNFGQRLYKSREDLYDK